MNISNEFMKDFIVRTAYHSNALDNRQITLAETVSIIAYNTVQESISLDNLYAIDNHKYAFIFLMHTQRHQKGLSIDIITEVHEILRYRLSKNRKEWNKNFTAIKYLIDELNKNLQATKHPDEVIKIACSFHIDFMHANDLMNGRTGRVLLSYLLWQNAIPPFVVQKKRKTNIGRLSKVKI